MPPINSALTPASSPRKYSAPVLGLIFLRFAEVLFAAQRAKLESPSLLGGERSGFSGKGLPRTALKKASGNRCKTGRN
jgi:hypothetical protein